RRIRGWNRPPIQHCTRTPPPKVGPRLQSGAREASRAAAPECSPRRKRMRKKSRMRAPPWKSGASAPRKRFEINAGFSPGGYSPSDGGLFPHPRKPWVPRVEPASPEGAKEKLRHRLRRACPEQAKRAEGDGIRLYKPLKTTGKEETCLKQKGLKNHLNI